MCQTQVFNCIISKVSLKWLSVAKSTEEFLGNQTLNILSRGRSEDTSQKVKRKGRGRTRNEQRQNSLQRQNNRNFRSTTKEMKQLKKTSQSKGHKLSYDRDSEWPAQ